MRKIVVGVDGSEASKEALRWAVAEARLRGDRIVAVHAWSYPPVISPMTAMIDPHLDFEGGAREVLDSTLAEIDASGVPVEKRLVQRSAADALLRASADADLLVVGSRGRGGFSGLLLGSVGSECVHHASCPVVVIRNDARAA